MAERTHYLIKREGGVDTLSGRLDFDGGNKGLLEGLLTEGYTANLDGVRWKRYKGHLLLECLPPLSEDHIEILETANYDVRPISKEEINTLDKEIDDQIPQYIKDVVLDESKREDKAHLSFAYSLPNLVARKFSETFRGTAMPMAEAMDWLNKLEGEMDDKELYRSVRKDILEALKAIGEAHSEAESQQALERIDLIEEYIRETSAMEAADARVLDEIMDELEKA